MSDLVELVGTEPNGLAQMMAAIAEGNLRDDPSKTALLDGKPGVIHITATDAEVMVALEFRDGRLRVYSDTRTGEPDVEIVATSEALTANAPTLGPVPHPFKKEGRRAWRRMFSGEMKVKGAVTNGKLMKRMRGLLG
jgi:hypothetical protein